MSDVVIPFQWWEEMHAKDKRPFQSHTFQSSIFNKISIIGQGEKYWFSSCSIEHIKPKSNAANGNGWIYVPAKNDWKNISLST